MEISDLSARELARLDAICLEFESRLRSGHDDSIDQIVSERGGESADLLRRELEAVRMEVEQGDRAETLFAPFGISDSGSTPATPSGASAVATRTRSRLFATEQAGSAATDAGVRDAASPPEAARLKSKPSRGIALPREGDIIGPYQIGRAVGHGGMGAVYEAVDLRLDRLVAIKVLAVGGSRQRELTERFEREAKAVASLSHPNIVELFDVGVISGLPYAVMEFLRGETLEQRLQQQPMTPADVRRLGSQIADALAVAHAAGVIHRDLKPQNIMLLPGSGARGGSQRHGISSQDPVAAGSGVGGVESGGGAPMVKLFDFGLSRSPGSRFDGDPDESPGADSRTRSGIILGTPGYLAPEQARGEAVTHAADIFGLGCVLYEAFYGTRAFDGATPAERFAAVLRETPTTDPQRRAADPALAELIDRCLAKDPWDRPSSADEITEQLRRSPGERLPDGDRWRRNGVLLSRRHLLEAAAGGIVGVAAGRWLQQYQASPLEGVHSLAVLTLVDESSSEQSDVPPRSVRPLPAGDRSLLSGELLSGMIVNELSRLDVVTVPKFVPRTASTPAEFRAIGREMEVDALLSGTFRRVVQDSGTQRPQPRMAQMLGGRTHDAAMLESPHSDDSGATAQIAFNLQIVSSATGKQLWGQSVMVPGGDDFIQQTRIAGEIAQAIGCTLETSAACEDKPAGDAYSCLVKARTYADPDSVAGLRRALACFQHASEEDPRLAASHAGIALTSITLAAQSSAAEATERIEIARAAVDEALRLSQMSIDARLAKAMLQWQTLYQYDEALRELRELSMVANNHWQVHHQYGLLLLILDQVPQALDSLRLAKRLHPASVLLKTDHWRAEWFRGQAERAVLETEVIRDDYDASPLARGLLIDIHEQAGDLQRAAAQHDSFGWRPGDSEAAYFAERSERLQDLPYGPFGPALNQMILDQRRAKAGLEPIESVDRRLARLRNTPAPMLPLLLARHPALRSAARSESAAEVLPSPQLRHRLADHGEI